MAAWSEVSQLHSIAKWAARTTTTIFWKMTRKKTASWTAPSMHYVLNKTYHCELEKDKKRAVRKRAATLVLECLSSRTEKSR